jgi:hypothetical protein
MSILRYNMSAGLPDPLTYAHYENPRQNHDKPRLPRRDAQADHRQNPRREEAA